MITPEQNKRIAQLVAKYGEARSNASVANYDRRFRSPDHLRAVTAEADDAFRALLEALAEVTDWSTAFPEARP